MRPPEARHGSARREEAPVRALRRRSRTALALLALLLSGCGVLAPSYERPAAPVATRFPSDTAATPGATPAADIAWQTHFQDPQLRTLIALALEHNRDLQVAVLNIEQARAQLQLRRADELPTVQAGAAASRQPTTAGGISSSYTAGLSITGYELDLFGRVRNLGDAALAQLLATEEARKTVQIGLVAAVANTWLSLLADDALLRLTADTLRSREESLRLVRLKVAQGVSPEVELRQAESLREAARIAQAQWTRQQALDRNALTLLTGQPALPAGAGIAGPLPAPATLALPMPDALPSELLVRRPDVRQAEQQLRAAHANIGAARAAFFPRITLTTSIGTASAELGRLFHGGTYGWSFAPQITLPLFDAGRNQAGLDAAEVGRSIAVAQYERVIQTAFREVADVLSTRETLEQQQAAQVAQAAAEGERLRLTELRQRHGAASALEVLDAQRSSYAARQAVLQLQLQLLQSQVNLYKVLGGGWKDPAP